MKYQRVAAVPHLRRGVPDRSTVYSIAKYVPAVDGVKGIIYVYHMLIVG